MSAASHDFQHNPFATRYVRPGALPYYFPAGVNAAPLVERLADAGWRGQIVGPHGSGKSTLLATLLPIIAARGRRPHLIALHDGQRRLPDGWEPMPLDEPTLIVVDGYEQLGLWQRWRLDRLCRRRQWGLLVTAHQSVSLPTLFLTVTTAELAEQLVDRLAPNAAPLDRGEIAARFVAHQGNLRELLLDCYDLDRRRRAAANQRPAVLARPEPLPADRATEDFSTDA